VTALDPDRWPFISVLIPVRGETEEFVECLGSLSRQTYPHDRFEVLVADASAVPIDAAIMPGDLDAYRYPNPGRTKSRGINMLASYSRGDYLAFVDAHSWVPDDYLERMVAVSGTIGAANVGTKYRKIGRGPWGRAVAAATTSPLGVGASVQHYGDKPCATDSAFPGFVSRATFDRVGGLNGDLACNEDDEFNARVRAAGGLIWYDPSFEVTYRPRETVSGVFRQHYRYGRWKIAVARLGVPDYLRLRHAVPSLVVAGAVAGPVLSLVWLPFAIPTALAAAAYCGLAIEEGRRMGRRNGANALRTAAVFPIVHAGYGLGFLRGLLDQGLPNEG
jgi:succinoglycan biosynthesis protein ExoA